MTLRPLYYADLTRAAMRNAEVVAVLRNLDWSEEHGPCSWSGTVHGTAAAPGGEYVYMRLTTADVTYREFLGHGHQTRVPLWVWNLFEVLE